MKFENFPQIAALLLVLTIFHTVSAQQQPCTQPLTLPSATESNIFSDEQEIYLGDAIAERIQNNYHVIEDPEIIDYLAKIGERLTKHLPINRLRFQFFLVDLPDANAFVIPGGRIFVSRKLVAAALAEDELAGVIAHELGHLVVHQSAIDTTRQFKALGITAVTDRADIFEKYNRLIDNINQKPGAFKIQDREKGQLFADQAGMFALVAAGYDANAMSRFWDRITETQGKKGSWLTDFFGTTRPEQKRLREMVKATESLPAECRQKTAASQSEAFALWKSKVVAYNGLGRKELLHGVLSKQQLTPPLLSDIVHLRFSPDGAYILAQDDAGINVLSREPFAPLFRIDTEFDTYYANFTPDSKEIVFYSDNLRIERWSIAEAQRIDVKEVVLLKGCLQSQLSPDGKLLACLDPEFNLNLLRVENGETVWTKKDFYKPNYYEALRIYNQLRLIDEDSTDLNLGITRLRFSPDGRYFVAGHHIARSFQSANAGEYAEVVDTSTFAKVSIPDSLKKLIAGGFTFVGNDRIAGINPETTKKSAVVKFPSGEVVAEMELWRKGMTGATRGDYLLIRPVKDYAVGVMDIASKTITKANERAALDIYEPYFIAEMRNGQVGLYKLEKNELVATAVLSNASLGRLRVAEISPELKWLALSGRSRGGVWNLGKGEAALALRNFQGGYLSDDGYFFGEFPKTEDVERNVARFNLTSGEAVAGPKIEGDSSHQYGQYLFTIKSAKAAEKPAEGDNAPKINTAEYRRNVIIEMFDARTMKSLWSQAFPKEAPRAWIAPGNQTMALLWSVSSDAAKSEISADPRLTQTLAKMKEKVGDYFLKIVDAQTGKEIGKLLIETGKASFRASNIFAAGDSVIVTDTQNRVLVYSLKTGEQKGRVFGAYAAVSPASKLLCVENESGKLAVYDLATMEKRDEFIFTRPISMLRFSQDGKRLFVLTTAQTVYILDVSSIAKT
jgi:WD40 repeat protein